MRWMSPELFEDGDNRRTKCSDCYALGMVMYEVLSGHAPFHEHMEFMVPVMVLAGKRPERAQEADDYWFTDDVWGILQDCWKHKPGDRPSVRNVLHRWEWLSGGGYTMSILFYVTDYAASLAWKALVAEFGPRPRQVTATCDSGTIVSTK
jgi:serine/threonine protein kinase